MSRILTSILAFSAMLALSFGLASAGDLKQIRDAQKIAAQKLTQQVDDAIEFSRKQEPRDAKFALQDMIRRVKDSADLLERERAPLISRLQVRLNVIEDQVRTKRVVQDTAPPRELPSYKPPVSNPGSGISGGAKSFIDSAKNASKTNADLIREREKGRIASDLGIEKSAVLTDKEMTLPADWKQKQERRVSQKLTPQEAKLLKTLNSTLSIDYDGAKLKSVISELMDRTGLIIIVDEGNLRDANIDYESDTVTFKFPKMTVRTALKKILGDKGLTYIIKDGNIQVMTPKKASEFTVIRTYQIDDLVTPDPRINLMFGPFATEFQVRQNGQAIVNLVQSLVEPGYWAPNGPGTIVFEPLTRTLIVRASAEMHYQMGSPGLFGGR